MEIKNKVVPDGLSYCLIDNDCISIDKNNNLSCYNKGYLPVGIDDTYSNPDFSCSCVQGYCENEPKNIVE